MPNDARTALLQRIAYIQAELSALSALVAMSQDIGPVAAPAEAQPEAEAAPAAEPEPAAQEEELPPEPEGDVGELTVDPVAAAEILGVARQTIDRRLKQGRKVPGGPVNVSRGEERARWRWRSEDDVRRWWDAVK